MARKKDAAKKLQSAISWLTPQLVAILERRLTLKELEIFKAELAKVPNALIKGYALRILTFDPDTRLDVLQDDAA